MALKEKFGKLILLEEIDAQPLGVTYRAARLGPAGLDRIVTLLRYSEAVSTHPHAPSRLAQHCRVASRLRIPGLMRVLGIGRVEQSYYASFELMDGRTLRAVIDRTRQEGFPFTADNALMVASRAAAALAALHGRKDDAGAPLCHGLVKPSHLVVSWEGDVRMMGLGFWPGLRDTDLLGDDDRRYLAPEQRAGEAGDARADVHALALVLLEMLTGRAPDGGDPLAALAVARHTTAAGEEEPLPGPIVKILRRGLVPEPSSRYAAIEEMRTAIDTLLFSGDLTPTTFNLAFFMHTLFREDMEREAAALAEASQADYSEYLPRPAPAPAADEPGAPGQPATEPRATEPHGVAPTEHADEASSATPGETVAAPPASGAAEPASEPEVAASPEVAHDPESPARAEPPSRGPAVSGTASADASGSGRRTRPAGVRGARAREGTLKFARASPPKRGRRGLILLAGLVAAVAVGGGLGYLVLGKRSFVTPSATTLSPDAAAALARVRELETRLAELEREKAEMKAQAETRAEQEAVSPSPAPAPSADADAAARARAEARRRARAERMRREAEIGRLEAELRAAEERLVGEQQAAQRASEIDLSATLPTLAAPPPTPEPVPPPTTLPPVRPGDVVEAEDPAVTLPVFLSEQSPGYPPAARSLRREGSVLVEALVDERGSVRETKVVESAAAGVGFEDAAIRGVKSRRYRPATKNGVPVRIWIRIRVNFTLE
jgi:serine/threonine-protein kinase